MPEAGKKNKKFIIIAIILAIIVAAAIALVFIFKNKPIDESYFVSDNTKLVRDLRNDFPNGLYGAKNIYMVYNYTDNQITKLVTYYEFESEEAAKTALEKYSEIFAVNENNEEVKVEGKYISVAAKAHLYEGTTTDSIRNIIDDEGDVKVEYTDDESVNEDATVEIVWD